eukprot:9003192-Heterocapsa_arctica.AAC.1
MLICGATAIWVWVLDHAFLAGVRCLPSCQRLAPPAGALGSPPAPLAVLLPAPYRKACAALDCQ